MKLARQFAVLAALVGAVLAQTEQWPVHDDGLNQVIEWDHYSLKINGERVFIWSGEMHYWRIPVPQVWRDILEKTKAAGFNTVAFYGNWGFHSATRNTTDFETGAHNIESLFSLAKEIGLYIIFRPGPYVNAEAHAGGFPGWVTTGEYGTLRNNDTRYTEAWKPYMTKIGQIVSKHLVTNGGNVILYQLENEYGAQWLNPTAKTPNWPAIDYMEELEANARESGIDIPLYTNAPNMGGLSWSKDYSNVGGEQDIYGVDSYPNCWSCDFSECTQWGDVEEFKVQDYYSHFALISPTQPSFLPEFQGGSYNPWGGPQGGCRESNGPDFVSMFYRDNISQRITLHSVYMLFGGTNWGGLACPLVGTSYDYSSPIQETRLLGSKYQESKILGLQVRTAKDLTMTERIGNGTAYTDNSLIWTTELRNPETKSGFYIVRHNPSTLTTTDAFKISVSTSKGNFTIPQLGGTLALVSHEAKILSTDTSLPNGRTLVYSTAEVLSVSTLEKQSPLLVLWTPASAVGEFLLSGVQSKSAKFVKGTGKIVAQADGTTLVSIPSVNGVSVVKFADGLRVLVLDKPTASITYVPSLASDPKAPLDKNLVVIGPSLVRSAKLKLGVVALTGDTTEETTIEVFAPPTALILTWNGKPLAAQRTAYGSLITQFRPSLTGIKIGGFNWTQANGLPESSAEYDDSKWTIVNATSSPSVWQPETLPPLFGEDHKIWMGNILWRGRFTGSQASGVYLSVAGGNAMGYSAYLNGVLVGSFLGDRYTIIGNTTFSFANATLNADGDNVLLVVQDHTGKGLRDLALIPRGIFNATLQGVTLAGGDRSGGFNSWRVAGTAGRDSETGTIDPIRGTLNEGGLHAERLGWHLPGFKDTSQQFKASAGPAGGISTDGMAFYRTEVDIKVPKGLDASLAVEFDPSISPTRNFRLLLFVNGYQFGKIIEREGNQIEFPVPPGILNYNGKNTIGVNLWAQEVVGAKVGVSLKVLGVSESSFDALMPEASALRPGYQDRSAYY
ncbi:glycoside hydrolase superfamily [Auriculariales sp. MPI-PUGE-AT-0066]|nr:glycoside hydrolase superfamily [Auriculariales sp. MPI-PUGE-AT-0066]